MKKDIKQETNRPTGCTCRPQCHCQGGCACAVKK